MDEGTTVQIYLSQNDRIWATTGLLWHSKTAKKDRQEVVYGPIMADGKGLASKSTSMTWQDMEQKGYQLYCTVQGVPSDMAKVCVAAIAHVLAGHSPASLGKAIDFFQGELEFARKVGEIYLTRGLAERFIDLNQPLQTQGSEPKPNNQDLGMLLKTRRESSYF